MRAIFFITLFLSVTSTFAQSVLDLRYPYMSDYFNEMVLYNPAYAGDRSQPWIAASGRMAKRPNEVNPLSGNFFVQGQIESINSGIGLAVQYNRFDDYYTAANSSGQTLGQFETNKNLLKIGVVNNYALNTDFLDARLGVNVGLMHFTSDQVPISTQQNPVAVNETFFKFNFDLGALFIIGDFDLGLAMNNVNQPRFQFFTPGSEWKFVNQGFLNATYHWQATDWLYVQPSALLNIPFSSSFSSVRPSLDAGVSLQLLKYGLLGVQFKAYDDRFTSINREPYSWSVLFGARINTLHATVSYHPASEPNFSRWEATLGLYLPTEEED